MKIKSEIFTDKKYFEIEKNIIFNQSPLFLAHIDSLKRSPIKRINLIDESFILSTLNKKYYLNSNLCPHRLTPLDTSDFRSNKITCPYHGLNFDLNGEGINHTLCLTKKETHLTNNLIFNSVHSQNHVFNFVQQYNYHSQKSFNIKANWKLCLENLLDQAHINFVHQNTLSGIFKQKKINHFSDDNHFKFFVEDKNEIIYTKYFIFPNLVINHSKKFVTIYSINPIGPTETEIKYTLLTNKNYYLVGFFIALFSQKILKEDILILEKNQTGQNTNANENILIKEIDHFPFYFYEKYLAKLVL